MKRAEIILAETRKKDTLAEVRRKRNALVSEMPSRVADEVGTVADNSVTGTVVIAETAVLAAENLVQVDGEMKLLAPAVVVWLK